MRPFISCTATGFLASVLFVGGAGANVKTDIKYDVRAQTHDRIRATMTDSQGNDWMGKARQGSFGAPSINDKGTVAYACILSGSGISAYTSNSVVVRLEGHNKARVALQAGQTVNDSFLPEVDGKPYAYPDTGEMYRIAREVALNNKNAVGFAGQLTYQIFTPPNKEEGSGTFNPAETSVYGALIPLNKKATSFSNQGLTSYKNFFEGILKVPLSLNSQTAVTYSGSFPVGENYIPGFAYSSPSTAYIDYDGTIYPQGIVIANIESSVIGLPYFTTFESFSDPVITSKNVVFLVADISDEGDEFDGIWQGNNPNLKPVVVKNTKAPGGGEFSSFGGKVGPSKNGKLCAFTAIVSGGSSGVFRADAKGNNLIRIASVGKPAPDNSASGNLGNFSDFELAATNNSGQVALLGTVGSRSGIWLSDKKGNNLSLIVIEGQTIKIGSKTKTITKIAFSPISGLNRKGQVAFTATFTDRTSAVIVAEL